MSESEQAEVSVYVCQRCIPDGVRLPRQWAQDDAHVVVHVLPCSGKTDTQYLFHVMEGGARGLLVVTCPKGQCHLAQGNYRAQIRVATVQRLLAEIGIEPERAQLAHCGPDDDIEALIREAVGRICALGESPVGAACS